MAGTWATNNPLDVAIGETMNISTATTVEVNAHMSIVAERRIFAVIRGYFRIGNDRVCVGKVIGDGRGKLR